MPRCLSVCLSVCAVLAPLALGACGAEAPTRAPEARDPVVAAALNGPLMTDPDLAGQNQHDAVLTMAGPDSAPVPLIDRDDAQVDAARRAAAALPGGPIRAAPAAGPEPARPAGLTAASTARAALGETGLAANCAGSLAYSAVWAARLPPQLPVYPRGHVQEAAGSDAPGCRLRVATFLTPVPLPEVIDFYWTRASVAGLAPRHRLAGADHVLAGRSAAATFTAYLRTQDGLTAVDLVTSGL